MSIGRIRQAVLASALAVAVGACGGGGDDSGSGDTGVRLSGRISAAEGTATDLDVNDPSTSITLRNDLPAAAQEIGNPVIVGGYSNLVNTGPSGNTRSVGDDLDFYLVSLRAGQTVTLNIGDIGPNPAAPTNDLDLFLFDADPFDINNPAGISLGVGNTETVDVPADDTYLVVVFAFDGASNYVLSVGQEITTAAAGRTGLGQGDIVPGEARVRWKQPTVDAETGRRRAAALGMTRAGGVASRWDLVRFEPGANAAGRRQAAGQAGTAAIRHPFGADAVTPEYATLVSIKNLRKNAEVELAEPNFRRRPLATPNDTHYPKQWHYPLIELPLAWDLMPLPAPSPGPVVAVLDTGVVLDHQDLRNVLVAGFDFISDPANAVDGNGRDNNPDDPGDLLPGGSSFHGTHVAGTVAAESDNNEGVAGVAWRSGTRIMPLRVLGAQGGNSNDLDAALLYAAGLDTSPAGPRRADIVNMSLGGPGSSAIEAQVIADVVAAGVIVIAAAGNENSSLPSFPAAYPGVVSVSAVGPTLDRAPYSNFGSSVDVAAPGGDAGADRDGDGFVDGVLSTAASDSTGVIRNLYAFENGTSMAAPHVAGVAAMMKAIDSTLTPAEFDSLLAAGLITDDLGSTGRDDVYGHGLINARKAVEAVQTGVVPNPVGRLLAVTGAINLGSTRTQGSILLRNVGAGDVDLTGVNTNQPWLSASSPAVSTLATNQQVEIAVSVNRATLADGSYQGTVQVQASPNSVSVPVQVQVGVIGEADAGYQYVLLIDMDAGVTGDPVVAQVDGPMLNGVLDYSFTGVAPGNYQIVTGTDANNDGFICDPGEACGSYLSLDQPVTVAIGTSNRAGLDFITGYDAVIQTQAAAASGLPWRGYRLLRRRGEARTGDQP